MKKLLILLLCTAMLLSGCATMSTTRLDKTSPFRKLDLPEVIDSSGQLTADFYEQNGLDALSVGILHDGKVQFYNYGERNADGQAVNEDTIFPLGSTSEIFTGLFFSSYVSQGSVTATNPITKYFPMTTMPTAAGQVFTLHQLATHTSGLAPLPDNTTGSLYDPFLDYDHFALRRYMTTAQLNAAPGEQYEHSPLGMALLGQALANGLRAEYEPSAKNMTTYRTSMSSTSITTEEDDAPMLYVDTDEQGNELEPRSFGAMEGGLGFTSTAYDMLMMSTYAIGNLGLNAFNEAFDTATAVQYKSDDITVGYGFKLIETPEGNIAYQSSSDGYFASAIIIDKAGGHAVVVLSDGDVEVEQLAFDLLNLLP